MIKAQRLHIAIAVTLLYLAIPWTARSALLMVNPDIGSRLCPTKYLSRDGSYEFNVRILPKVEEIFVEDRSIVPGTTEHVVFLVPKEAAVYIVSTKIADKSQMDELSLLRSAAQRRRQVVANPSAAVAERITTKFGDTYSLTMLNVRTAGRDVPFPLAYIWQAGSIKLPASVSAHRFFVAHGHLVEVAVLLLAEWQPSQGSGLLQKKAGDIVDAVVKQIATPGTACAR